ncbi:MAG: hypothetical protein MK202_12050 [Tenacibaculum sp.]|nr:hypothetical protein [Tenacibaculum sp.]
MIQKLFTFFLFFQFLFVFSQDSDKKIFKNPYKWKNEIIDFPVKWAPKFNLRGHEEILFSPNWSKPENPQFWTLLIAWEITTEEKIGLNEIRKNLFGYFDGLMKPNHWSKEFPEPVLNLELKKEGFFGKMTFFDGFHTGKMVTVNIIGNQIVKKKDNVAIIYFKLSPKEINHVIWKKLNTIEILDQ